MAILLNLLGTRSRLRFFFLTVQFFFFNVLLKDATELDDFIDSGNEFHRTGATVAMSFEFAPRHNK